ncbi:hypothetical protein H5410_005442 [Solanum commersonii]|uniref:Pectinesterase catalytic domain-containing protein n=1 Tax=Solanum commersonii TaxID=4109 RepID=A0A9J6A769_SOLCO|nr:hypothetical protein H5410_005442 [Solanum commersonii]
MAQDITFRNIIRVVNYQTVALRTFGQFSTLYRCQFNGFQDTLYRNHENKFHKEFIILGITDFIFGDANVLLQNCLIEVRINRTRVNTLRLVTLDVRDNEFFQHFKHFCTKSVKNKFIEYEKALK